MGRGWQIPPTYAADPGGLEVENGQSCDAKGRSLLGFAGFAGAGVGRGGT